MQFISLFANSSFPSSISFVALNRLTEKLISFRDVISSFLSSFFGVFFVPSYFGFYLLQMRSSTVSFFFFYHPSENSVIINMQFFPYDTSEIE